MKIINGLEMRKMPAGTVFVEYVPDIIKGQLMVVDENYDYAFGATEVIPWHGEVFDFDWNSLEYKETDLFMVFDNNDILQMIKTLTNSLDIKLKEE